VTGAGNDAEVAIGAGHDRLVAASSAPGLRAARLWALAVGLAACLAYLPALRNGFVDLDDGNYVAENRHTQKLSVENVRWAFTAFYAGNWHPLTWLSHAADSALFGLDARRHHMTSVLLHAANAALLVLVLHRLTRAIAPSVLVGALFALHPLNVESVAWIAERKNLLSTLFWILTMGAYARYAERPAPGRYALVVVLFALGLMAKPMLVTLPFVLLLLDAWPLRRFSRRALLEKVPLVALSAASSVVTVLAQRAGSAVVSTVDIPMASRASNAVVSYVRYLALTVWPRGLSVLYPLPGSPEAPPIGAAALIFSAALLVAVTVFTVRARRRAPFLLVGWLWYVGTLVPVIGIVQVGGQAMADRYAYVPLIGIFIAVAWSLPSALLAPPVRPAALATVAVLAALGVATAARARVWHDPASLWRATLTTNPRSRTALINSGAQLIRLGRRDEAIARFRECLAIDPAHPLAALNLGAALAGMGREDEAVPHLRSAARAWPANAQAQLNLAWALEARGRRAEAARALRDAMAAAPATLGSSRVATELAWLLATSPEDGVRNGEEAARLAEGAVTATRRRDAEALDALAAAYAEIGRYEDARAAASEALSSARVAGKARLAGEIESRMAAYAQGRPFRVAIGAIEASDAIEASEADAAGAPLATGDASATDAAADTGAGAR